MTLLMNTFSRYELPRALIALPERREIAANGISSHTLLNPTRESRSNRILDARTMPRLDQFGINYRSRDEYRLIENHTQSHWCDFNQL